MSNVPKLRFSEFGGEWEEKKLSNIISLQSGFAFKSENFSEDGNRLVIPKNFTKNGYGLFDEVNTKYTIEKCDEKYICKTNDLLILLTDLTPSCELLGKPLLIKKEDGILLLNQRIAKVLPTEYISVGFLQNFFLTISYHLRIKNTATGSTVRHSSNKIILDTDVYIPSKQEQEKIASFLTSVDTKIEQLTKKEALLQEYKKGVMSKIFNQEIRFKDDDGSEFSEWEKKKLGDISTITTGSSNREDSNLDGEYTFFDRSEDIRTSNIFLFDGEAIIVAGEGQRFIPKYFIGKFDLHQRTYAIMNFNSTVGKFIYYYISYNQNYFLSQAVGSTVKSLRLPMFQKMDINFPCITEQTKIANFLSSIDKKIQLTTKELNSTKEFKKALLQQMFV